MLKYEAKEKAFEESLNKRAFRKGISSQLADSELSASEAPAPRDVAGMPAEELKAVAGASVAQYWRWPLSQEI